jgi:putative acetyltransferase
MVIRERTPADDSAIRNLNDSTFGGTDESRLIEGLRAAGFVAVELVAVDPSVAGHILFSALDVIVGDKPVRTLALAPMAVQPHRQCHGIGSALVRAGLQRARERGWQAVIVLGHHDYHPRFGFSAVRHRLLARRPVPHRPSLAGHDRLRMIRPCVTSASGRSARQRLDLPLPLAPVTTVAYAAFSFGAGACSASRKRWQ